MASQTISMNCPGCGAPVTTDQVTCKFCKGPITISTFNSVYSMPMPQVNKYANAYRQTMAADPNNMMNQDLNNSLAMCYLKLKMYDQAGAAFAKAIENNFDNSESFFYAAICLLKGKKAFAQMRGTIDKIEEYIQAATMIEPRGVYYYFWAYIKYDYYSRKHLITNPNYQDMLAMAQQYGYSPYDADQLFEILGVARPTCL